ncbi:MAG TPA: Gfo/Idh/MocA family oxidoreductase [Tepidisphaeraceae bacterium]|nr:Gfo/Idh/MocA family oxidoreductase [Tepidisphaeraceae bacterium]
MAQGVRVGILGAGWPGVKHAEGYRDAGGFSVTAVADLIPGRRKVITQMFPGVREFAQAEDLLKDPQVDAVSICLPNLLHAPVALAALKAGKHVLCETPPALNAGEAKKMSAAAGKAGKVLLYAAQRRFGGAEQAAAQAVAKGYVGDVYHARASWMRTRGIPAGTGWFTDKSKSGGGAMIDLGAQMLDLAWLLLGRPRPQTVMAILHQRFGQLSPAGATSDVEDAGFALIRFEGGKSLELSASWAINQSPRHQGTACRLSGDGGAVEVYAPGGPVVYRNFGPKGEAKESQLKLPKVILYPALMRHFRACIQTGATPSPSGAEALTVMQILDAIYKSDQSGKSVEVRTETASSSVAPVFEPVAT